MSGGRFEYKQYQFGYIADDIEGVARKNGKPKTREELKEESWRSDDWYERYPEDLNHYKYPDEVVEKFKEAVKLIRTAQIYVHRIDWLLSGDDGEESFLERLAEDLENLNRKTD